MQEKQRFTDVLEQSEMVLDDLIKVATSHKPSVPPYIIKNMMAGKPVKRMYAEATLTILSQYTGRTLNLDTVEVALEQEGRP